jgi:WD40 repeat protein
LDQAVILWDLQSGAEIRRFIGSAEGTSGDVAFAPDGKTILTGNSDGTARLWDIQTGQELRRFTGHASAVEAVAYSPDGQYVLTGSDDGTARLWDVDYHQTIRYLCTKLHRDFTEGEREAYGISDRDPTCSGP